MSFRRFLTDKVLKGMSKSPAILLVGTRQSGKSFLMKQIAKDRKAEYMTFDNLPSLASAREDPVGFIRTLHKPAILDEIQRIPELFLPIKEDIDNHREEAGRYTLTGSADPLMVPKMGDSLAGRMLVYELYPLSQGEIRGKKELFLENAFSENPKFISSSFNKTDLIELVLRGGYPEAQKFQTHQERSEWADSYLFLILQKDIQDLAKIEGFHQLPNLLISLASQIGSFVDYGNLAKSSSIPVTTLRRYVQLLHSLFIIHTLPSWSKNLTKRLIKSPKVYFVDTLILLQLLNFDGERLKENPKILGKAAENFVVMELLKQTGWSQKNIKLFHFHTDSHNEVDLILEDERGKVVAIEIKSSETIGSDDFRHIKMLKETIGQDFFRGIVLYAGHQTLSFGPDLLALPISTLWS